VRTRTYLDFPPISSRDGSLPVNVAATIADELAVSVADARVGAAIRLLPHDEVVVLTSDLDDITRVAGGRPVQPVRV